MSFANENLLTKSVFTIHGTDNHYCLFGEKSGLPLDIEIFEIYVFGNIKITVTLLRNSVKSRLLGNLEDISQKRFSGAKMKKFVFGKDFLFLGTFLGTDFS